MRWTRAKDWLMGALGMLLVLGVAVAVLWWVGSPAGDGEAATEATPGVGSEHLPGRKPPPDLREDEVWLADLDLAAGTVVIAGSTLRDVRAVGQDVVARPDGLVAARLAVDVTVPFEVVADDLGPDTVVRDAGGGQARVVRTVEVLGRELRVVASGTVEVEAGRLVVEPRSIDFGGPDLLSDAVATAVRGLVSIEHDIEGLPEGLVLQDVTVQSDGFRAHLLGMDIRFVP